MDGGTLIIIPLEMKIKADKKLTIEIEYELLVVTSTKLTIIELVVPSSLAT
jgi:hypothetical protein